LGKVAGELEAAGELRPLRECDQGPGLGEIAGAKRLRQRVQAVVEFLDVGHRIEVASGGARIAVAPGRRNQEVVGADWKEADRPHIHTGLGEERLRQQPGKEAEDTVLPRRKSWRYGRSVRRREPAAAFERRLRQRRRHLVADERNRQAVSPEKGEEPLVLNTDRQAVP